MVLFLFHCDSLGFAAARMDVRAFNWQIIPALAMLNVCCSITYEIRCHCAGWICRYNSNIQHTVCNQKAVLQVHKTYNLYMKQPTTMKHVWCAIFELQSVAMSLYFLPTSDISMYHFNMATTGGPGQQSPYSDSLDWTVWGFNPNWGKIFRTHPNQPRNPPSLLYNAYWAMTIHPYLVLRLKKE
jgi:hypothetical protein